MFAIMLIIFFIMKIKAPNLPNNDNDETEETMKTTTKIGIVATFVIAILLFVALAFSITFDSYILLQSLGNTFVKVVCPIYFINSLPNLKNHAIKYLKSFLPTPQVAPYDIPV